jgi:hypothetical protein
VPLAESRLRAMPPAESQRLIGSDSILKGMVQHNIPSRATATSLPWIFREEEDDPQETPLEPHRAPRCCGEKGAGGLAQAAVARSEGPREAGSRAGALGSLPVRVVGPNFVAGLLVDPATERVIFAAPILGHLRGQHRDKLRRTALSRLGRALPQCAAVTLRVEVQSVHLPPWATPACLPGSSQPTANR